MRIRGAAVCCLALQLLTACGGTADPRAGQSCDPGDRLYEAIRDDPAIVAAEPRRESGSREGVRSSYDRKSMRCTPIVLTRQWSLAGADPAARLTQLAGELEAAGWRPRDPLPTPLPGGLVVAQDFDKQLADRAVTLAVSYYKGRSALTGFIEVPMEPDG